MKAKKLLNFFKWKFASYITFLVINKQKLMLYFLLTKIMSELLKYLNEQLGVFLNVEQQKWS